MNSIRLFTCFIGFCFCLRHVVVSAEKVDIVNPDEDYIKLAEDEEQEETIIEQDDDEKESIRSYFVPPQTGEYKFFSRCHAACDISLGDDRVMPEEQIISVAEDEVGRKKGFPEKASHMIFLQQGQSYLLKTSYKKSSDSNGSPVVGVVLPDDTRQMPINQTILKDVPFASIRDKQNKMKEETENTETVTKYRKKLDPKAAAKRKLSSKKKLKHLSNKKLLKKLDQAGNFIKSMEKSKIQNEKLNVGVNDIMKTLEEDFIGHNPKEALLDVSGIDRSRIENGVRSKEKVIIQLIDALKTNLLTEDKQRMQQEHMYKKQFQSLFHEVNELKAALGERQGNQKNENGVEDANKNSEMETKSTDRFKVPKERSQHFNEEGSGNNLQQPFSTEEHFDSHHIDGDTQQVVSDAKGYLQHRHKYLRHRFRERNPTVTGSKRHHGSSIKQPIKQPENFDAYFDDDSKQKFYFPENESSEMNPGTLERPFERKEETKNLVGGNSNLQKGLDGHRDQETQNYLQSPLMKSYANNKEKTEVDDKENPKTAENLQKGLDGKAQETQQQLQNPPKEKEDNLNRDNDRISNIKAFPNNIDTKSQDLRIGGQSANIPKQGMEKAANQMGAQDSKEIQGSRNAPGSTGNFENNDVDKKQEELSNERKQDSGIQENHSQEEKPSANLSQNPTGFTNQNTPQKQQFVEGKDTPGLNVDQQLGNATDTKSSTLPDITPTVNSVATDVPFVRLMGTVNSAGVASAIAPFSSQTKEEQSEDTQKPAIVNFKADDIKHLEDTLLTAFASKLQRDGLEKTLDSSKLWGNSASEESENAKGYENADKKPQVLQEHNLSEETNNNDNNNQMAMSAIVGSGAKNALINQMYTPREDNSLLSEQSNEMEYRNNQNGKFLGHKEQLQFIENNRQLFKNAGVYRPLSDKFARKDLLKYSEKSPNAFVQTEKTNSKEIKEEGQHQEPASLIGNEQTVSDETVMKSFANNKEVVESDERVAENLQKGLDGHRDQETQNYLQSPLIKSYANNKEKTEVDDKENPTAENLQKGLDGQVQDTQQIQNPPKEKEDYLNRYDDRISNIKAFPNNIDTKSQDLPIGGQSANIPMQSMEKAANHMTLKTPNSNETMPEGKIANIKINKDRSPNEQQSYEENEKEDKKGMHVGEAGIDSSNREIEDIDKLQQSQSNLAEQKLKGETDVSGEIEASKITPSASAMALPNLVAPPVEVSSSDVHVSDSRFQNLAASNKQIPVEDFSRKTTETANKYNVITAGNNEVERKLTGDQSKDSDLEIGTAAVTKTLNDNINSLQKVFPMAIFGNEAAEEQYLIRIRDLLGEISHLKDEITSMKRNNVYTTKDKSKLESELVGKQKLLKNLRTKRKTIARPTKAFKRKFKKLKRKSMKRHRER